MDTPTQHALIEEILGLSAAQSAYLDESVATSDVRHYTDPDRFAAEMEKVFRAHPIPAVHCSELPESGSFLRRQLGGIPVLISRDRNGQTHAFINVCRHRGARLVNEETGCKSTFSCPYHGWTWSNSGELRGIPHQKQGFPEIDKSQYGLHRLPCEERHGWIWIQPTSGSSMDLDAHLAEITPDLNWLGMGNMRVAHTDIVDCGANWKILTEGGIESYHFRVAHAATIGPFFPDNLSTYQMLGLHMRSILPRVTMDELRDLPKADWVLRDHANIVYTFFAGTQWLVQQDHVVAIQAEPIAADRTILRMSTIVPAESDPYDSHQEAHWARNHAITKRTLTEDFDIGEAIQQGLNSGANDRLTFGRYEGALDRFNQLVNDRL